MDHMMVCHYLMQGLKLRLHLYLKAHASGFEGRMSCKSFGLKR